MSAKTSDKALESDLLTILSRHIESIEVEVGHSARWDRRCVTFRWPGFADLLPEERFERLVRLIPEEFRDSRLEGFVWLELAPGESVDAFLKLPRSEAVADREQQIYVGLEKADVFGAMEKALHPDPIKTCQGGFGELEAVLKRNGFSKKRVREAKLLFILHGAYCDCQALLTVREELAKLYAAVP